MGARLREAQNHMATRNDMRKIPLMIPTIDEQDIENAVKVLRSGMLVQGKYVQSLEESIKKLTGTPEAVAVSNGTATLHLALVTLGIGEGDEVIVPAFSYVASANVIELVKAKPVFVDVDLSTFNIDPSKIEAVISPSTKALMVVHEFGLSADMEAIIAICKQHNLLLIEDAACALGATCNGKPVGSFGDFGSFSFHPRKAITSGEGGILVTGNGQYAAKLRVLRNHGIEIIEGKMEFTEAGFNYRMTDFQAALLTGQADRLSSIIEKRQALADLYFRHITSPAVTLPVVPANRNHTWQTFHVLVDKEYSRDAIREKLLGHGIETNYGAQCIPAQKFYKQKYAYDSASLYPNAYISYTQGLALPMYDKLTEEDIIYISQTLNTITS
jgi:perosamine synthetase